jgi:hypothetical protein
MCSRLRHNDCVMIQTLPCCTGKVYEVLKGATSFLGRNCFNFQIALKWKSAFVLHRSAPGISFLPGDGGRRGRVSSGKQIKTCILNRDSRFKVVAFCVVKPCSDVAVKPHNKDSRINQGLNKTTLVASPSNVCFCFKVSFPAFQKGRDITPSPF